MSTEDPRGAPASGAAPSERACGFGELCGASEAMREVFDLLARVSATDAAILVEGETGTGKELVAEAIHAASPRRNGPLVVCDLSSLPRSLIESELFGHVRGAFTGADRARQGAFEQAEGGTIFLDEIGDLDLEVQPRLLRALERRQVKPIGGSGYRTCDVRVIAATNRDLFAEVQAGRFRQDLYHRLAVVRVRIPPLRERREDVALLAQRILERATVPAGRQPPELTPSALSILAAHDWPGNVRELRNALERAVSLAPDAAIIDPALLVVEPAPRPPLGLPTVDTSMGFKEAKDNLVSAWEQAYLSRLLERTGGNVSLAARRAGIDRVYLHRLLRKHRLALSRETS